MKATFRKDRRLNIRLSSKDLEAIQKRALGRGPAVPDADFERAAQVRVRTPQGGVAPPIEPLEHGVALADPARPPAVHGRGRTFQLPGALLRRLESAFGRGSGHGLLELGAAEVGTALPADFSYWRDFGARLVTAICTHPDVTAHHTPIPAPALSELEALAAAAPPMTGAEYLTASVLEALWTETARAFRSELAESKASVQAFLQTEEPCVASRRPRPFQSRREPPGR